MRSKEEDTMGSKVGFVFSMLITGIFLTASLVLVIFWVMMYRGGYAWQSEPKKEFNFHPTLMVAGFIFFSGFSMLFYRMVTCCRKIFVKLLHTVFHAFSIVCIAIGFLTVWDSHELENPKIPNFYSLHSWLGLTTMGLFAIQFVVGFFSFLILLCCEGRTAACRAALVPTHATFGIITFVMACATAVTGITEKAIFTLGAKSYSTWETEEALIVNVLGVVIAAAAISIVFTLHGRPVRKLPIRMTYHTDL
ncbi:unnamed protein product [Allacma fusca]|uniref:Cytochrome b561 domain-containing protein n=1 Tax=Allacma fusca TaxID=39272 RepID=A0A8J2LU23_9HEXA|nr:unnamed protein product [Allacma fusca]